MSCETNKSMNALVHTPVINMGSVALVSPITCETVNSGLVYSVGKGKKSKVAAT